MLTRASGAAARTLRALGGGSTREEPGPAFHIEPALRLDVDAQELLLGARHVAAHEADLHHALAPAGQSGIRNPRLTEDLAQSCAVLVVPHHADGNHLGAETAQVHDGIGGAPWAAAAAFVAEDQDGSLAGETRRPRLDVAVDGEIAQHDHPPPLEPVHDRFQRHEGPIPYRSPPWRSTPPLAGSKKADRMYPGACRLLLEGKRR
jgi:hypothetical protein